MRKTIKRKPASIKTRRARTAAARQVACSRDLLPDISPLDTVRPADTYGRIRAAMR